VSVPGCRRELGHSVRTEALAAAGQALAAPALLSCPSHQHRHPAALAEEGGFSPHTAAGKSIPLTFCQLLPHAAHVSVRPAQGAVWCPLLRALAPRMCFNKNPLFTLLFPGHRLGWAAEAERDRNQMWLHRHASEGSEDDAQIMGRAPRASSSSAAPRAWRAQLRGLAGR